MAKRQRSRCIAGVKYHKSCPDDCEFKKFFNNDSEINYDNFFKSVTSASSLRALLNEAVDGRVKTDAEKLTQIRSILIEENISQRYPITRAAGIIYTLQKRIESLELQLPETSRASRMAPLATVTRDPLYNVDSFTGMNSTLDPFLNYSTQCFLNDSAVGNMDSSMVSVGGSADINPNQNLTSSGSVGMGSNTAEMCRFCLNCHTLGSGSAPSGCFPRNTFTASSLVQTNCSSVVTSLVVVQPSFGTMSNQTEPHLSVNPADQDPQLYNSGVVTGVPAPLPQNSGVVMGVPAPLPQPSESNHLEFGEDMDDVEQMIEGLLE